MKKLLFLLAIALSLPLAAETLTSPDGHIRLSINLSELKWQACYNETVAVDWSPIGLSLQTLQGEKWIDKQYGGADCSMKVVTKTTFDNVRPQVTYVKRSRIHDHYNMVLTASTDGFLTIEWRVYNDGIAYRIHPADNDIRITDEVYQLHFTGDYEALLPYENDLRGGQTMCFSYESFYDKQHLSEMYADSLCITPLCVSLPNGIKVIPAETNIRQYPGMFLKKGEGNSLKAVFPKVPTEFEIGGFTDLNLLPTKRTTYIAERKRQTQMANGEADFSAALPWRAVGIFANDADILNSDMMQCLAQSDIMPEKNGQYPSAERGTYCGQSVWDWWNDWGLTGVDFKPGINNQTYEYYARFAAANHVRYMIVDDGWSDHGDLMKTIGDIDIPALVDYADRLGVGVILWSSYRALLKDTEKTMDYFANLGVKGFKVDFFDRNDQIIVDDVWRLAQLAAERHLFLDFHGYMPIGIQAVYPNVLSYEGVKGLENFKWEKMKGDKTEHNHPLNVVQVPFLRGFVGPYDYTPGSMRNATYEEFAKGGLHTIGTRCNQLAMFIVQEAPLQMLADSPTEYEKNETATRFITSVPTIFDETKVIDAKLGEYIVIARRQGQTWYVAAITDKEKDIDLPLSFLSKGKHTAEIIQDGVNAAQDATDSQSLTKTVKPKDCLHIHMAYAGGWVAIIR